MIWKSNLRENKYNISYICMQANGIVSVLGGGGIDKVTLYELSSVPL